MKWLKLLIIDEKMKNLLMLIVVIILSPCGTKKYNGMILVDPNTDKKYMLHSTLDGGSYFVFEETLLIQGKDTTMVFK